MPRTREASREDIISAARAAEGPAFVAVEVADRLPIGPERTRHRLQELAQKGVIHRKNPGQTDIYWFNGH